MSNTIKLDQDKKDSMISHIKKYFSNERDENLGDLAATLVLDFFIEKLGPEIYNQGVQDSHTYMSDKIQDLFEIQKY